MNTQKFIDQLATLRSCSTFLSIKNYRNEYSEVADYSVVFNIDYAAALKRSIATLDSMNFIWGSLEACAQEELLNSFKKSLANPDTMENSNNPTYRFFKTEDGHPIKGVKEHKKTGTIHLYGLVNFKSVKMPGIYPTVKSAELTVTKNKLRSLTPCGKFVQFKMLPSQVESITSDKITLTPPSSC